MSESVWWCAVEQKGGKDEGLLEDGTCTVCGWYPDGCGPVNLVPVKGADHET